MGAVGGAAEGSGSTTRSKPGEVGLLLAVALGLIGFAAFAAVTGVGQDDARSPTPAPASGGDGEDAWGDAGLEEEDEGQEEPVDYDFLPPAPPRRRHVRGRARDPRRDNSASGEETFLPLSALVDAREPGGGASGRRLVHRDGRSVVVSDELYRSLPERVDLSVDYEARGDVAPVGPDGDSGR